MKRELEEGSSVTPTKKRRASNLPRSISNNFSKTAYESLNEFRKNGFLCDFEIRGSGKILQVHRNILAAKSQYFRSYFSVNPNNKGIEMGTVNISGVEHCVEFMYTGKISVNLNNIEAILDVASMFQLEDVTKLCCDYVNESLAVNNCLVIRAFAEKYRLKDLEEQAEKMAAENLLLLINDKTFAAISKRELIRLLNQNLSSQVIWSALMVWIMHDPSRKNELSSILGSIKMSQFSVDDLITMTTNQDILTSPKSLETIGHEILRRFSAGNVSFTPENWSAFRNLFIKFNLIDLEVKVNKYVLENFVTISKTDAFCKIDKLTLTFFLKAFPLSKVTEKVIWDALIKWTKFHEERQKCFSEIVKTINLSQFSFGFIKSTVKNEPFVVCDNDCLNMVIEALCSQAKS